MQVTKLDEDELFHTVPGFESDMTLSNPSRTSSEATYATYASVYNSLSDAVEQAKLLTPEEVFAISVRAGIHNPDGSLTEMYREPDHPDMVEDGYGKLIPRMPNYPTLDGLSFEEWDKKQDQKAQQVAEPEPAAAKPSESVARGHFVIRNFCRVCWREQDLSVCPCGNSDLHPVLVKR